MSQVMNSEIKKIPFHQLVKDPENVRKTDSKHGIEGLAANICELGLLQNLVVRPVEDGRFAVTGGERRRAALALLIEQDGSDDRFTENFEVPCMVISGDHTSVSLSENVMRKTMHPMDQFQAFAELAEQGQSEEEIANGFGVTVRTVQQRLKLGQLAEPIRKALREDELSVENATAFTLTDDHKTQLSVYEALKAQGRPFMVHHIRNALTEDEVLGSRCIAQYVGEKAYMAAGGEIRRDLFSKDVFYRDAALLTTLATGKLQDEANRLKSEEGWKWIEISLDTNWGAGREMRSIEEIETPLTEEQEAEIAELESKKDDLEKKMEEQEWNDEDDAALDQINDHIDELREAAFGFRSEDKVIAGGFLSIHRGGLRADMGYIRSEDDPETEEEQQQATNKSSDADREEKDTGYNKALKTDLAALRRGAIQINLLSNPEAAADLMHFHLIRDVLMVGYTHTPFEMSGSEAYGSTTSEKGDMGDYRAPEVFEELVSHLSLDWTQIKNVEESFEAYQALTNDEKQKLMAYAAALMLQPQLNDGEAALEQHLAQTDFKVSDHWTPDIEFFARLKKAQLLEIAASVCGPEFVQMHESKKKGDLATILHGVFHGSQSETSDYDEETLARIRSWTPDCMKVRQD